MSICHHISGSAGRCCSMQVYQLEDVAPLAVLLSYSCLNLYSPGFHRMSWVFWKRPQSEVSDELWAADPPHNTTTEGNANKGNLLWPRSVTVCSFHAVTTWSTHSRTSSTRPWFISAGLWCLKWRKSLLSHSQGHPALRRSLHGKQRPRHSKNSLCFESRRVCIPALLLFLLSDHRWAVDFPKWPCEKLGLLQRSAPISWTQLCSVFIDLFMNCCWWE